MTSTSAAAVAAASPASYTSGPQNAPDVEFTKAFLENYAALNRSCLEQVTRFSAYYQPHAAKNKEMILKGAEGLRGTAIILGLGNGTDTPLEELSRQFDKVIAVDLDLGAMERAISKLPKDLQAKLELMQEDVTGIGKDFSSSLENYLKGRPSFSEFRNKLIELLNGTKPSQIPYLQGSYVISNLIVTQLCSGLHAYIMQVAERAFPREFQFLKDNNEFNVAFSNLGVKIQIAHLEDLNSWLQDGKIYLADTMYVRDVIWAGDRSLEVGDPKFLILQSFLDKKIELFTPVAENGWRWVARRPAHGPGEVGHVLSGVFLKKRAVTSSAEMAKIGAIKV